MTKWRLQAAQTMTHLISGSWSGLKLLRKGLPCALSICQRSQMHYLCTLMLSHNMQHILHDGSEYTMERRLVSRRGNAANVHDGSADVSLGHRLRKAQAQWQRCSCPAQRCPADPQLVHACSKVTNVYGFTV